MKRATMFILRGFLRLPRAGFAKATALSPSISINVALGTLRMAKLLKASHTILPFMPGRANSTLVYFGTFSSLSGRSLNRRAQVAFVQPFRTLLSPLSLISPILAIFTFIIVTEFVVAKSVVTRPRLASARAAATELLQEVLATPWSSGAGVFIVICIGTKMMVMVMRPTASHGLLAPLPRGVRDTTNARKRTVTGPTPMWIGVKIPMTFSASPLRNQSLGTAAKFVVEAATGSSAVAP